MIKGIKVKLYPTKEQETLMWKSAGVMRFAYNWALRFSETYYKLYGKSVSIGAMRKHFTKIRNSNKYPWLKEVSSEIPQQAIKDFDNARSKFFKKAAKYPRHKSKKKSTISFYHLPTKFKVTDSQIQLEKRSTSPKSTELGSFRLIGSIRQARCVPVVKTSRKI
jgi:putative transposase